VQRIDPKTNRVVKTIRLGATGSGPQGIAVAGSGVWVGSCAGARLLLISVRKNRIVRRVRLPGFPCPEGVVANARAVWVANNGGGSVSRYDIRRRRLTGTRATGNQPRGIALGGGSVWVVNSGSGTVARVAAG
jgi:DNA-binding beta-propeller fold protein YncE